MSFPLIQQDSPLQKLADVLRTIRTDMETRRANQEQLRRQQEYLQLHQAQFAAQERERGIDNERASRAEQRQTRLDDIAVQQGLEDRKRRGILDENAMTQQRIAGVRAGLPDNVTITDEAALLSPEHRQVLLQGATADARQGLQGSASRAPVMGSYKGVTVDPGMRNVNQPAGGGVSGGAGRFGHIDQRTRLGAGLMQRIISRANELYSQDPATIEVPMTGDIGAAVAERVLGHGAGARVGDRIRNVGATQAQQEFRGLREQFKHSMAVFFPRVSIALMENLSDSYFPVGGETGEAAAAKMAALNDVGEWIQRVTRGEASVEQLASVISQHNPALGSQLLADNPASPATNATGQSVSVPAASPSGSALDRYLGRVRQP